ncbi:MAG: hypothetical protein GX130_09285 [Candidatus Hydrogenedens sp.]|nr:hypothetical protein [Candidatus Hydrogenedens sp.]
MRQTKRLSIISRGYSLDKLHRGLLMSLHPGISLLNGLIGVILYIIYSLKISIIESLQKLDPSILQDMDVSFIMRFNLIVIAGYKPIFSEMVGLFLGFCLCILEIQELRTIGRTAGLRLGFVATLYKKCDVRENIEPCRKFRTFRRVELFKRLCLIVPILAIGAVTGAGLLIPVSLAFLPSAFAAIFRKKLLVSITDDISASQVCSVSALQDQYRILSRFIIVVAAGLFAIGCGVLYLYTGVSGVS